MNSKSLGLIEALQYGPYTFYKVAYQEESGDWVTVSDGGRHRQFKHPSMAKMVEAEAKEAGYKETMVIKCDSFCFSDIVSRETFRTTEYTLLV